MPSELPKSSMISQLLDIACLHCKINGTIPLLAPCDIVFFFSCYKLTACMTLGIVNLFRYLLLQKKFTFVCKPLTLQRYGNNECTDILNS